tara:strand:- start:4 stop:243 length:240 start_codon:yes stop_codon:yes gene_type:complete
MLDFLQPFLDRLQYLEHFDAIPSIAPVANLFSILDDKAQVHHDVSSIVTSLFLGTDSGLSIDRIQHRRRTLVAISRSDR